jgi:hypothetical protein
MNSCKVCNSKNISRFLQYENVPVHQNLIYSSKKAADNAVLANLSIFICNDCDLVFNVDFDETLLSYGPYYDNTQDYSEYFRKYTKNIIEHLVNESGLNNKTIVEIGSGNGVFLKGLCKQGNNRGIGFDPSYEGVLKSENIEFIKEFYGSDYADIKCDAVLCRHVLEHVSNPLEFLATIKAKKVFFEVPSLEWILRHNVFWDFFYEHCSYFSEKSIRTLFKNAGFRVDSITSTFNGQYLWIEADLFPEDEFQVVNSDIPSLVKDFISRRRELIEKWHNKLNNLKEKGKIALWGAGAKGVTFASLVDKNSQYIYFNI